MRWISGAMRTMAFGFFSTGVGGAPGRPPLVLLNRRVHVTVEDQALALATAGQRAEHVGSVGHQRDLPRGESLAREPVVDVLAHRPLGTGGAVDVRQVEGHLHQLVDVDLVQHALGTCADVHARDSLSVRTAKRGSGALLWSIRWISARRLVTAPTGHVLRSMSARSFPGRPKTRIRPPSSIASSS